MAKKTALLLDGGHARVQAKRAGLSFHPDFIEKLALSCSAGQEELYRILYYDCAPYAGSATLPISGNKKEFSGNEQWLHELARKDLFAVRRGVLKFRGFVLNQVPHAQSAPFRDEDFKPQFEQKGVDMRIGLDMATFAETEPSN